MHGLAQISVKSTGHDYNGRGSSDGSINIFMKASTIRSIASMHIVWIFNSG